MNPTVLITGGFGNLGSWITREFLRKGYEVTVTTSSQRAPRELEGVNILPLDLSDPCSVQGTLGRSVFDIVIHAGSLNDGFDEGYHWKSYRVNVEGTSSLLHALNTSELKHFIYLSTFHVYGCQSGCISESTPCKPVNDYATSHLAAEYVVQQHHWRSDIPITILRLTNGYGCPLLPASAKWHLLLNDLARMAINHKKLVLKGAGNAQRDFIWMGDIARAVFELSTIGPVKDVILNMSFGRALTLHEAACEVLSAYYDIYSEKIPLECEGVAEGSPNPLIVDSSKIWNVLGWKPSLKVRGEALETMKLLNGTSSIA